VYALQFFHSGEVQVTTRYTLSAFDFAACHTTSATCSPLWKVMLAARPEGLAIANGLVYVSTGSDQRIAAYDATGVNGCSGTPRVCAPSWSTTLRGSPTSPIVANGVVFVGTRVDNVLHALKLP
jgi:outer membrane protein assembly factor BamB